MEIVSLQSPLAWLHFSQGDSLTLGNTWPSLKILLKHAIASFTIRIKMSITSISGCRCSSLCPPLADYICQIVGSLASIPQLLKVSSETGLYMGTDSPMASLQEGSK